MFPGDATLERAITGKETDRVYVLHFSGNATRKFFFWMQDKEGTEDDENVKKLNEAMNGPAGPGSFFSLEKTSISGRLVACTP